MARWSILLLMPGIAAAQAAPPSEGEILASGCQACHGAQHSPALPPLQGRKDLRERLRAFREAPAAEGEAHLMIRFARGLTEADIDAIAAYYEAP